MLTMITIGAEITVPLRVPFVNAMQIGMGAVATIPTSTITMQNQTPCITSASVDSFATVSRKAVAQDRASTNTFATCATASTPRQIVHNLVTKTGVANLPTPINVTRLKERLLGYDTAKKDFLITGFSEGFKIMYNGPRNISRIETNHYSALCRPAEMDEIISEELQAGQIFGPFETVPLDFFVSSPIALVPKQDGSWRFIHNLSFPDFNSINTFIDHDDASVHYESLDYFISLIQFWGVGSRMGKIDIRHAFRNLPIHPSDYHLLGLSWRQKFFINCTLCMGLSTSCALYEKFACALQWCVTSQYPPQCMSHLLDDALFVSSAGSTVCGEAMSFYLDLCKDINLPVKTSKTVWPCTTMVAHGLEVDSIRMEVRLPIDKLRKCKQAIASLINKRSAQLVEIQQVHGLLNFACRAIAPGRAFLRRLADLMQGISNPHHYVTINKGVREDLKTWLSFLANHNGVTAFREPSWTSPKILAFYTDASGSWGYGGFLKEDYFSGPWPTAWGPVDIQTKEIFPIFLGLTLFGDRLRNKKLLIYSDNEAVVEILNHMTSKSKNVMIFVRLIVRQLLKINTLIRVFHVPGFLNTTADLLSRNMLQAAQRYNRQLGPEPTSVPPHLLPDNWTSLLHH